MLAFAIEMIETIETIEMIDTIDTILLFKVFIMDIKVRVSSPRTCPAYAGMLGCRG